MSESINNRCVYSESKNPATHKFLPWVTKDDLTNEKVILTLHFLRMRFYTINSFTLYFTSKPIELAVFPIWVQFMLVRFLTISISFFLFFASTLGLNANANELQRLLKQI